MGLLFYSNPYYQAESAVREVEAGNREKARAEANAALKLVCLPKISKCLSGCGLSLPHNSR